MTFLRPIDKNFKYFRERFFYYKKFGDLKKTLNNCSFCFILFFVINN